MTESIAKLLGFQFLTVEGIWYSRDKRVTLNFDQNYINAPGRICYMHVDSEDYDTIGSLDFTYLEEFITMLELCEVYDLAEGGKRLLYELTDLYNFSCINHMLV